MNDPTRQDWPAIIRELGAHLTPYKIGLAVGLRARDIIAIRDHGRRVEHFEGELILALLRSARNGLERSTEREDPPMLSLRSLTI